MIPEFLALRYQGIRRIDEILAKAADFGWKCRKYIKWRKVYNAKDDGDALYRFADALVKEGRLELDLYGQISGVCLNVQKWRLDRENMSVEPPTRKEWEKRDVLFKAIKANPALLFARLAEHRVTSEGLSSLFLQILFYACELDSFFQAQGIESYPPDLLSTNVHGNDDADFCSKLLARFEYAYRSIGVTLQNPSDATRLLQQVMDDLGFPEAIFNRDLAIPSRIGSSTSDCLIELVPLEKFRLIDVDAVGGINHVRLNTNHRFIKSILTGGSLSPEMEDFFRSYANCMLRMAGSLDTLQTFNSHLGIELHMAKS